MLTGVESLLAEIAAIGRDPHTGGYRRFAFTREDAALAEWFSATCSVRGLDVTTDRCGNQWAWWGDPDAAPVRSRRVDEFLDHDRLLDHDQVLDHDGVLDHGRGGGMTDGRSGGLVIGSHLDSVPDGGPFDGPLGVVTALAAIDLLREGGFVPDRPIGVVRFVDEEGARFGLACSGSRLLTGRADPARVLGLRDHDGTTYAEAMRAHGLDPDAVGPDPDAVRRIGAFVELHVEQGRALATPDLDAAIGVATMIRPHGRWRIDLAGRADHAGTTVLADRSDPMLDLARLVLAVRAAAEREGALATVGRVEVRPNAVNAVASSVTAWLDARADAAPAVDGVVAALAADGFRAERESWTPATPMDAALSDLVAEAVEDVLGDIPPRLATGAGHDAGVLAEAGVPTAMLFVRNPTGVSHAPDEHAEPVDCEAGIAALAAVVRRLASWPGRAGGYGA
jgi:N-carbamoyl-L-amino-acid hydrolase